MNTDAFILHLARGGVIAYGDLQRCITNGQWMLRTYDHLGHRWNKWRLDTFAMSNVACRLEVPETTFSDFKYYTLVQPRNVECVPPQDYLVIT